MLTVEQKIELSHLEKTIERGKHACIEMALALLKIREEQLYRENHPTFEAYCQTRWEFSDRYGRMLVEYGETIREMQAIGTIVPGNEAQSRALKGLKTEEKVEALAGAAAVSPNNKPTAQHIQRAATAVKAKSELPQPGQKVTVTDEASPHYRQSVEVVESAGVIVQAKTESGETKPFLINELTTDEDTSKRTVEKTWSGQPKTTKPSHYETLELENEILKQRCTLLEEKLTEAIELLKQRDSTAQIRSFVSEVQSLMA